ncbi:MAG: ferredoxin-thioredoxin reductase catalytic domain-containing protein [Candidatus Bathyarchaeia archaeon]
MTTLEEIRRRAESDAKTHGYYLNPNEEFLKELLEGLKRNEERYGYPSCPCRLASGKFELDRDIICPCDYRDIDVEEFGACYCALYVRKDVFEGKTPISPVPERRPIAKQVKAYGSSAETIAEKPREEPVAEAHGAKMKLWYCKQCGYVVYREEPPYICPICKAKKELFAEIRLKIDLVG